MSHRDSELRIVVAGLVGLYPVGGVAWDYLQYVIGLARLGHDVFYYEDTWSWPYDPDRKANTDDPTYSVRFLRDFFERYAPDLADRWRYVHLHERGYGVDDRRWADVLRSTDLFLNVSGASMIPDCLPPSAVRTFLDTDPGYNQILYVMRPEWSPNVDRWVDLVDGHDRHLTYAENIGRPGCLIPDTGHDWRPTRMPIVTELWTRRAPVEVGAWTTVMTWNDFKGRLEYRGREYRSKDVAFERLIDLPRRVRVPLAVAVGGRGAPADRLRRHGWTVLDAPEISRSPDSYQHFLAASRGEISPAKDVYVGLRTGWFSCRTACYLASGVPAVVEDTGFAEEIPTGAGLIAFSSVDEAEAGIERVESDRERHADAAVEIAREVFGSDRVLTDLIDSCTTPLRARRPGASAGTGSRT